MPHKGLLPTEEKVRLVESYLAGKIGKSEVKRKYHINGQMLYDWVRLYKVRGASGLSSTNHHRKYRPELKRQAVEEYLSGAASLREICTKYDISNKSMLQQWIKLYNRHGNFKQPNSGGAIHMAKGRRPHWMRKLRL